MNGSYACKWWHVERSRERLARTCQAKSSERRRRLELSSHKPPRYPSFICCPLALKQVARPLKHHHHRRHRPPLRPTHYPHHPPLLHDSPISASSQPLTPSTALDYPYSTNTCAPSQHTRLQRQPTTRRPYTLAHIIHHGSVIENACCCPRNGWRRRCSSAGKSCFLILCRITMVLACPCMRTCIYHQIPKELWISILGVCLATSCLATNNLMSCGCLEPALLLLVSIPDANRGNACPRCMFMYSPCCPRRTENDIRYASQSQVCRRDEGDQVHPRARWSAPAKSRTHPAKRQTPPHLRLLLTHLAELQSVRITMPDVMTDSLLAASMLSVSDH